MDRINAANVVQERAPKKAESFLVESSKAQGGQPGSWYNKSNRGEYRKEWQCAEGERKMKVRDCGES